MIISIIHPDRKRYRLGLLRTAIVNSDGWMVRCSYAPLQWTSFSVCEAVAFLGRLALSLVWCFHDWEQRTSRVEDGKICGWCGRLDEMAVLRTLDGGEEF